MRIPVRISPREKRFPATPAPRPSHNHPMAAATRVARHSTISRVSVEPIRRKARKMQLPPRPKPTAPARKNQGPAPPPQPSPIVCAQRASTQSATTKRAAFAPRRAEETGGLRSTHAREGKEKRSYESGVHPKGLWRITRRGQGRKENVSAPPGRKIISSVSGSAWSSNPAVASDVATVEEVIDAQGEMQPPGRAPTPL